MVVPLLLIASLAQVPDSAPERADDVAGAASWSIDPERSLLAVVTHKAGFAATFAHNHLIVSRDHDAALTYDAAEPLATRFELVARVEGLVVDDPALQQRVLPRMDSLDLLDAFGDVSDGQRREIRETMLDDGQLDAEEHPTVTARVTAIRELPVTRGAQTFQYLATVETTVRGRTVSRDFAARLESLGGGAIRVEAIADFRFREFGIEPFSKFLGSVKVEDGFQIYVVLVATP